MREPWEESDDLGTVTYATVQTVSAIICCVYIQGFVIMLVPHHGDVISITINILTFSA